MEDHTLTEKSHEAHMWPTCDSHVITCEFPISHVNFMCCSNFTRFVHMWDSFLTCVPTCDHMWPLVEFGVHMCGYVRTCVSHAFLCVWDVWPCAHMGHYVAHMCAGGSLCGPHDVTCEPTGVAVISCEPHVRTLFHMWVTCGHVSPHVTTCGPQGDR